VRPSTAVPLYVNNDVRLPDNQAWDGPAIRVAVVDTGWPVAQSRLDEEYNGQGGVTVSGNPGLENGKLGMNPGDASDEPDTDKDDYLDPVAGHGMFIAGLLLQYAPGVSVKVVSALTTYGDGNEWSISRKINELVRDAIPPHIINLSFGTYAAEKPDRLAEAITSATRRGIVVVASAGNDGTSRPTYPAAYAGVVSVGALGPDGPATFSNWGEWVRASAPGVDVASGFWTFNGKTSGEAGGDADEYAGWALWSGTSFSAPIVAAALARELQAQEHRGQIITHRAVDQVLDHPRLHRLPCFGTVINPPPTVAGL
jgi:hypothetical protein